MEIFFLSRLCYSLPPLYTFSTLLLYEFEVIYVIFWIVSLFLGGYICAILLDGKMKVLICNEYVVATV